MARWDRSVAKPDSRIPMSRELLAISVSLFFSAMGANAFVQFVVNYLVQVANWPAARATLVLVVAFGCMPVARVVYPQVERRLGDTNCLLAGNALFLLFLGLLAWVRDPWLILPAGLVLGMAGACVFTAGPLRILAATPAHHHSAASGIFFATNFLAWFVAVTVYGQVVRLYGIGPALFVAMVFTLVGLLIVFALPQRPRQPEAASLRDFLGPLGNGLYRTVMFFMALSAVAFGLMFSTLTQFLTSAFGASLMAVGISSFYLARLPGSLVAGYMISRWGQRRFLSAVFALSGVALLAVSAYYAEFTIVLAAILILGFQQATVPVAAMALAGTQTRDSARQAGYGLLFAASEFGVALSLVLAQAAGSLLGNFGSVFLVFGMLYVLGGIIAWQLRS